jgi:hypothetical protein
VAVVAWWRRSALLAADAAGEKDAPLSAIKQALTAEEMGQGRAGGALGVIGVPVAAASSARAQATLFACVAGHR